MVQRNVFLSKEVTCPACKKASQFTYPNPRFYVAAEKERDMRVKAYRWAEGISTDVLPHYHAVWQCPLCMFADFTDLFTNPQGQISPGLLPERFNKISMEEKLILASLRKMVPKDPKKVDLEGALAKHLSAIFITFLLDRPQRNHNNLGRLALRTAWLFREKCGDVETVTVDSIPLKNLNEQLSNMDRQMLTLREIIEDMVSSSRARADELGISEEVDEKDENGENNPYESIIESLRDKLQDMHTVGNMLERLVLSDSQGEFQPSKEGTDKPEVIQTLLKLKDKWPTIPIDEGQALRIAISAFDYSYNNENYYQSIEQSMSVVGLIVELYTRMGNLNEALSYVGEIYKSGMNSKQGLDARMSKARKNKTLSNHDERMIKRKIGNINISIKQAGDTRRSLISQIIKNNKDIIDKVISENPEQPVEEKVKALVAANIPEPVVAELKSKKIFKEDKKKGLFNF